MANFDWDSGMGQAMKGFMNQMMGIPNKRRPTSAGLRSPAAPAAPAAPLLGSLASSYFKKPQAGLAQPGAIGGPPQAGLQPMGNRARGEASWTQRYGTAPKWSRLPQE